MLDITKNLKALHTQYGQQLRATLIRSLRADPLLVEAEEVLHSIVETDTSQMFRGQIRQMLREGPLPADVDDLTYMSDEREVLERFRAAMRSALRDGSSLSDAEQEILSSLGFEKLGEFRSKMQSHLGGPAEIPEEDLAIYIPAGEGRGQAFREAIEEQLRDLAIRPEMPPPTFDEDVSMSEEPFEPQVQPEIERLPSEEEALAPWDPFAAQVPKEGEVLTQASVEVTIPEGEMPTELSAAVAADLFTGLNPVPMLTAALEATGIDGEDFGFLLRYGRYAPEGRKSEFLVGGMGLAELSDRLAAWLKANGPMKAQVQVVDEGSGELMIYLLGKEI